MLNELTNVCFWGNSGRDAMSAHDPKQTQRCRSLTYSRFLGSAESHLDKFRYALGLPYVTIA